MYINAAVNILKALDKNFNDYSPENDAMLGYGTVLYPNREEQMKGVHKSIIYADFFYTEAILKLLGSEFNPWMK